MKSNYLSCLLIGLVTLCRADNETKDGKDKRQIDFHQTRINPHQAPDNEHETIYGSPNQFIRAAGQGQQHQQYQQPHVAAQPEQLQEGISQQYALIPNGAQIHQRKPTPHSKTAQKKIQSQKPTQYIQGGTLIPQYQDHQYQLISEEQILKLLQDDFNARQPSNIAQKVNEQQQQKAASQVNNQKLGLGRYREVPIAENPAIYTYVPQNIPQQYFNPSPVDYHRNLPGHPLAASSLEKELEKLVASNKPTQQHIQPQQAFKNSKPQQKPYTAGQAFEEKPFSFFPDFAQLSGFNIPQAAYPEQAVPIQKINQNNGQYLTEVSPKPKLNHETFQQKLQYYPTQQKSPSQYAPVNSEGKNAAMKVVDAPALQHHAPSPHVNLYPNILNSDAIQQSEPSRSAIFVSQGTGIRPTPQVSPEVKPYSGEKAIRLPPQDGKPITQEEFQALVEAGFPVQAVPVPVPVPYEKYIRQNSEYKLIPELERRPKEARQDDITYLHPIGVQHKQEKRSLQKNSS